MGAEVAAEDAVGIARVSGKDQEDGYSLDSQEKLMHAYADGAAVGAMVGGPAAAFFTALGGDWVADQAAGRRMCLVYRVVPWYIWASGLWIERC